MRCLNCNTATTPMQFPFGSASTQESDLKLSFHGADRSVTDSCHLVECAGKRILIDCGLHQGSRELDGKMPHHSVLMPPASTTYC